MKLGDIKTEALKLMGANVGEDISWEQLSIYAEDEQYRDYLVNMTGAVNRALANIELKGAQYSVAHRLSAEDGEVRGAVIRFDLTAISPGVCRIERVAMQNRFGSYEPNCDYAAEGTALVLPATDDDEKTEYILVYKPSLPRVTSFTPDDTELPVPERVAALIPYFIKGDLYRNDEPNEAGEARNWYEQGIYEYLASENSANRTGRVRTLYSQTVQLW